MPSQVSTEILAKWDTLQQFKKITFFALEQTAVNNAESLKQEQPAGKRL